MWRAIETDSTKMQQARDNWMTLINSFPPPDPDAPPFDPEPVFSAVSSDIEKIRARGGDVVFIRCPSSGPWAEVERGATPREMFWDLLLLNTNTGGVHYADHISHSELDLPEWSHLSAASAETFTEAIAPLVQKALETRMPVKGAVTAKDEQHVAEEVE